MSEVATQRAGQVLGSDAIIDRLRALRRSRSLSQAQLSERVGQQRFYIGNLENKRRADVGINEIIKLCAALDVDPLKVLSAKPLVIQQAVTC